MNLRDLFVTTLNQIKWKIKQLRKLYRLMGISLIFSQVFSFRLFNFLDRILGNNLNLGVVDGYLEIEESNFKKEENNQIMNLKEEIDLDEENNFSYNSKEEDDKEILNLESNEQNS